MCVFRFDEFITVLVTSIRYNVDILHQHNNEFSELNRIYTPSIHYIEPGQ